MPEIITPGNVDNAPERWPYTIIWRCNSCGCTWRLIRGEHVRREFDQRENQQLAFFPCPTCGKEVCRAH